MRRESHVDVHGSALVSWRCTGSAFACLGLRAGGQTRQNFPAALPARRPPGQPAVSPACAGDARCDRHPIGVGRNPIIYILHGWHRTAARTHISRRPRPRLIAAVRPLHSASTDAFAQWRISRTSGQIGLGQYRRSVAPAIAPRHIPPLAENVRPAARRRRPHPPPASPRTDRAKGPRPPPAQPVFDLVATDPYSRIGGRARSTAGPARRQYGRGRV